MFPAQSLGLRQVVIRPWNRQCRQEKLFSYLDFTLFEFLQPASFELQSNSLNLKDSFVSNNAGEEFSATCPFHPWRCEGSETCQVRLALVEVRVLSDSFWFLLGYLTRRFIEPFRAHSISSASLTQDLNFCASSVSVASQTCFFITR